MVRRLPRASWLAHTLCNRSWVCQQRAITSGGWPCLRASRLVSRPRRVAVRPGRLDQQAARVRAAGLGDRALAAAIAAGVLGGDQADPAHQLRRFLEAAEVADFGDQPGRGELLDAAKTAQPSGGVGPRAS